MTMQDLRQYSSMRAEIERLSRRLNELRLELAQETDAEKEKSIKALYMRLESLHKQQLKKELEITKQLEQINDTQVRISVQLHYIDGYTWNEIATKIGGGNTEDSCRKYVSRYFYNLSDMSQRKVVK